jgi:hypothetical protein
MLAADVAVVLEVRPNQPHDLVVVEPDCPLGLPHGNVPGGSGTTLHTNSIVGSFVNWIRAAAPPGITDSW